MDPILLNVIIGIAALVIGGFIMNFVIRKSAEKKSGSIIKEAYQKAEVIKKDKILQAKEKFLQLRAEHEKLINEKDVNIQRSENRLKQKESSINQKIEDVQRKRKEVDQIKTNLTTQLDVVSKKQQEVEKLHQQQVVELEKISGYSASEAKDQLVQSMVDEARSDAAVQIKEIVEETKINANTEAKKIVIETIQRTAAENAIENTVSVFNIESDEVKGRIIGREGRNIRTLEALTGIEIIIDDSPEAIILSGFDPVRT